MGANDKRRSDSSRVWRRKRSRAQSLVELAISMPLLLLMMLGTIDLGRAYFDYIQMRNGAFEGARYGSQYPTDSTGIKNRVMSHGVPSDATVDSTPSGAYDTIGGDGTISVSVSRTFTPITLSFLQRFWGLGSFTMNCTAVMKVMT
ncbi:MAG: TadE family protein [Nitrolancea sp.]